MSTVKFRNFDPDNFLGDETPEHEVSTSKKSRYTAAIDESDIEADFGDNDYFDLDIDDDLDSLYDDKH